MGGLVASRNGLDYVRASLEANDASVYAFSVNHGSSHKLHVRSRTVGSHPMLLARLKSPLMLPFCKTFGFMTKSED